MQARTGAVLLVEDDHEVGNLVAEMLSHLGWEAVRAESGSAALDVLQAGTAIDVVLSDVVMPGAVDGLALARAIRADRPELPVILTSGNTQSFEHEAHAGRFLLLPKPYGMGELAETLRQASDWARRQQGRR